MLFKVDKSDFNFLRISILFILLLFAFEACVDAEPPNPPEIIYPPEPPSLEELYPYECEFVDIDDSPDAKWNGDELEIVRACEDERYKTIEEIENNLKGEWELIGHYTDCWHVGADDQPCGYLWFEDKEVVVDFHDAFIDTLYRTSWEIDEKHGELTLIFDYPLWQTYRLNSFCDSHISRVYNGDDFYILIYEKRD